MFAGDSITNGVGSSSGNGFVPYAFDLLAQIDIAAESVGPRVDKAGFAHAGYGGSNLAYWTGAIDAMLETYAPTDVGLMIGTNDQDKPPAESLPVLEQLVRVILARASCVVHQIPPLSFSSFTLARSAEYNAGVRRIALELGASSACSLAPNLVAAGELVDHIHPNDAGHRAVAKGYQIGFRALPGRRRSLVFGAPLAAALVATVGARYARLRR
jgi:lysophospholipase L1-like esterase